MVVCDEELATYFGTTTAPKLVMSLHDELIFECPQSLPVDQVCKRVQMTMENAWQLCTGSRLRVRTPVKMSVGTSWGGLVPWTPGSGQLQ
jgi:DNA polymerase I-like protein with 3'-5' exonuclease and polymerase domains